VTGLTWHVNPEVNAKLVELLKEAVPKISRVAVLRNGTDPASTAFLKETQRTERAFGVRLQPLDVRSPADYTNAFAAITRERAEALVLLPDIMTWSPPGDEKGRNRHKSYGYLRTPEMSELLHKFLTPPPPG
jgi:putative ABC transport system substrate-binding protein